MDVRSFPERGRSADIRVKGIKEILTVEPRDEIVASKDHLPGNACDPCCVMHRKFAIQNGDDPERQGEKEGESTMRLASPSWRERSLDVRC